MITERGVQMVFIEYNKCPLCGRLHDDGAYYTYYKRVVFICLECADIVKNQGIKKYILKVKKNLSNDGEM